MTSSLRLWLLVTAVLAGALLVACNEGDGKKDEDGAAEQPTATQVTDGEETDGDGDGATQEDGDLSEELRNLVEQFGGKEVKIDYTFSSSTDGVAGDEGSITLFWKPPDAWRMDISNSGGDATLITSGDKSYLCTSEGGGQCMESPIAQAIPLPFLNIFTDPDSLSDLVDTSLLGVDVDRSDRSIAGQDATCFSVSGTVEGQTGSAEYCFRDDGILLFLQAGGSGPEGAGEFTLEATSVEDTVSDQDLEPPYEVFEIPGVQ